VFCVLTFYVDESYDSLTLCVGGWLCGQRCWSDIERKWGQRVEYERRQSAKRSERQISRFHASDCSNRRGEYEQWTPVRQKLFVRRLVDVLIQNKPFAIAHTCSFEDLTSLYPCSRSRAQKRMYRLCLYRCLMEVCEVVEKYFPGDFVKVIHDQGFNGEAQKAFDAVRKHHDRQRVLCSITAMEWKDSVALQAADLISYEGMKASSRYRSNNSEVRRSLRRIIGSGVGLYISHIKPTLFQDMRLKGAEFRKGE
jgi:hypothetical protein